MRLFFFIGLLCTQCLCGEEKALPKKGFGAHQFGVETLDSIDSAGLVKLNRTTVQHLLSVNGSLISQGASIGSIDVTGEAHLTDSTIEEGGSILGYLQTHHTSILKPLTISGQKAVFSASNIAGITVRPTDGFKGKQVIELRQKTLVSGPISFESGKGEIHLYPGSQILGPVSGAKVIKK